MKTLPAYIELRSNQEILLKTLIQPKASKSEIVGPHGEPPRLKIRIAAPPVDGEANEGLLKFLKKTLKPFASQLGILRGETSKQKDVLILCSGADEVKSVIQILSGEN